jgi:uncharacterized protein (TIGR03083 family)
MNPDDCIGTFAREAAMFIEAAEAAGPDAPVPTCPDWRVRDLVLHLGNIHHWAAGIVTVRRASRIPVSKDTVPDAQLGDWYRAGAGKLTDALVAAPDDLDCWTFLPGSTPRHFWARRQLHETTIHRVDAQLAAGRTPTGVDATIAVDGVDELLAGFHTHPRSRLRSEPPKVLRIQVTDVPATPLWEATITTEPVRVSRPAPGCALPTAGCEFSGTAEALYLALWNRQPYEPGVTVIGDSSVAELWRATSSV